MQTTQLSLNLVQRYKITDIINASDSGSIGAAVAGGQLVEAFQFTKEEIETYNVETVHHPDDPKSIIGHRWHSSGEEYYRQFEITEFQNLHLKRLLLGSKNLRPIDFSWLAPVMLQLDIKESDLT